MEARAGIEPAHKGFADLSLTTWVPRLTSGLCFLAEPAHRFRAWSTHLHRLSVFAQTLGFRAEPEHSVPRLTDVSVHPAGW